MKKHVILEDIGTWYIDKKTGKIVIECTVKEKRVYAESNNLEDLVKIVGEMGGDLISTPIQYRKDTMTWHHFSIEERKWAKRMLAPFNNK